MKNVIRHFNKNRSQGQNRTLKIMSQKPSPGPKIDPQTPKIDPQGPKIGSEGPKMGSEGLKSVQNRVSDPPKWSGGPKIDEKSSKRHRNLLRRYFALILLFRCFALKSRNLNLNYYLNLRPLKVPFRGPWGRLN